jgi:hypothetical protein
MPYQSIVRNDEHWIAVTNIAGNQSHCEPNAAFIAHARQDVTDLLAEADLLRAALAVIAGNRCTKPGGSVRVRRCLDNVALYADAPRYVDRWCDKCTAFAALNHLQIRLDPRKYSVGVWYGVKGLPVFDIYSDDRSELTGEEAIEILKAFRFLEIGMELTKVTTEPICLASTRADADRLPEDIAREWMRETYNFGHSHPTQADAARGVV